MIILSSNKHVLIDANVVFISPLADKEDKNKTVGYRVLANTFGGKKPTVVAFFETIEEAEEFVKSLAAEYGIEI